MPIVTLPTLPIRGARKLTDAEKRMADSVFGTGTIDYDKVRIIKRTQFSKNDTRATAPFGFIVYPDSQYKEDFSDQKLSARDKHTFIHEMTHIWQYQLKYGVAGNGLILQGQYSAGKDVYSYTLDKSRRLKDYNMEQQGDIVADYYVLFHLAGTADYIRKGLSSYATPYRDGLNKMVYLNVLTDFLGDPKNATKNLPKNLSFSDIGACCK